MTTQRGPPHELWEGLGLNNRDFGPDKGHHRDQISLRKEQGIAYVTHAHTRAGLLEASEVNRKLTRHDYL